VVRAEPGDDVSKRKPGSGSGDHGIVLVSNNDEAAASSSGQAAKVDHLSREVPTREEDGWRRLKEGEAVPPGFHVRLNMTSGEKWIKTNLTAEEVQAEKTTSGTPAVVEMSRGEKILELLGGIPDDEVLAKRVAEVRQSAQPGTEEFEKLALSLWEDRQNILASSKNDSSAESTTATEPRMSTLTKALVPTEVSEEVLLELDELVEDLKEAATFANEVHKGIDKCLAIIKHPNTSSKVKTLAAGVIGKAVKLAAPLQKITVSLGGFDVMKRAFQQGLILESKALYTLGSLIRGSRDAAMEALKHPDFFKGLVSRLSRHGVEHKIREKTAALVGDLLMEPKEWCWPVFRKAGLCHSSLDFTKQEVTDSPHFEYLEGIRNKVCLIGEKSEV